MRETTATSISTPERSCSSAASSPSRSRQESISPKLGARASNHSRTSAVIVVGALGLVMILDAVTVSGPGSPSSVLSAPARSSAPTISWAAADSASRRSERGVVPA